MKLTKECQAPHEPKDYTWVAYVTTIAVVLALGGYAVWTSHEVNVAKAQAAEYRREASRATSLAEYYQSLYVPPPTKVTVVSDFNISSGFSLNGVDLDVGRLTHDYGLAPSCTALSGGDHIGYASDTLWTPCRIPFQRGYSEAPVCVFKDELTGKTFTVRGTTDYVLTPSAVDPARWQYNCEGR